MQYQQLDMFPKTDTQSIIQGDCLEVMKTFPDNHFNCVVTDPPYGISFMNKEFDKFKNQPAFNPEYWKELLRICKPGTMLLAFGGDRTHHHLMNAVENAGWEIRTCIYWCFGSGFPKSYQFGKKLGTEWHRYGTALKPAVEIIVMAMKKLDSSGFVKNAEKWGNAGLNIDECRIGNEKRINNPSANKDLKKWRMNQGAKSKECIGRWPSNLILSEEAAEMLDLQSGISKSPKITKEKNSNKSQTLNCYGKYSYQDRIIQGHDDSGGASRFFYCAKASSSERNQGCEELPLIECQSGCGGDFPIDDKGKKRDRFKKKSNNHHPTVKPLKLMEYLIKLIAPPEALLLDPFAGSGSTLVACKNLEVNSVGIEISEEYCQIAKARLGM